MSFFGLSQQGTQEQLDFAEAHPVQESDIKPGFFQGAFDQPFSGVESAWAGETSPGSSKRRESTFGNYTLSRAQVPLAGHRYP